MSITKESLIVRMKTSPFELEFISDEFKNDKEVVLSAVSSNGFTLEHASALLQDDKDVVLMAVKRNGTALAYASNRLKDDREVVLEATKQGGALASASKRLQNDKEIVLKAISTSSGRALEFASETLLNDKEVVLAAVKQCGEIIEYASKALRDDKEVVLTAVSDDGKALNYASEKLYDDKDVVLAAVANDPYALEFAGETTQDNKDIVLTALSKEVETIEFASPRLQKDKDVLAFIASQPDEEDPDYDDDDEDDDLEFDDEDDDLEFDDEDDNLEFDDEDDEDELEIVPPKELFVFIVSHEVNIQHLPFDRLISKLVGENFHYLAQMGFKNGVGRIYPASFIDFSKIDYFKHNKVKSIDSKRFIEFNWMKAKTYYLARVRFVYWINDQPVPNSKVYDGHVDHFLIPYQISPGGRLLASGRKSLLIEEVSKIDESILKTSLNDLAISDSIKSNLAAGGYSVIGDLLKEESNILKTVKGMSSRSNKSYKDLETALLDFGVTTKKATTEVKESNLLYYTPEEAYSKAIAVGVSEIDWVKFFAIHNDKPYVFADVSNYDYKLSDITSKSEYDKVVKNEISNESKDYSTLINYLDGLQTSQKLIYIGYMADAYVSTIFETNYDLPYYAEEDSNELEIEEHYSEELKENQQIDEHQSPVFVSVGVGQYDRVTKEPNAKVIEFIKRYKDFDGFNEDQFLYQNIGFRVVVEIDHNNHSVFIYKGTETLKTTRRELDGEIKVIFLSDFLE